MLLRIHEVQNYGGFFGGDTLTLVGAPPHAPEEEQTLTIDQDALSNVGERHHIVEGMLLALTLAGERVERAELLGARTHAELRQALGPPEVAGAIGAARVLSYRCPACELWLVGQPDDGKCAICGTALRPA
jgi:hypothetical protein